MNLDRFIETPIPPMNTAQTPYDLPDAVDCGEPVIDITDLNPRIRFAASYLQMGVDGALERCYVRSGVYDRLCAALELLPERYGFLIYDTLRPLRVQRALFEDYLPRVRAEHPELSQEALEEAASEFVARPVMSQSRPSSHQSGGAVDMTLTCDGAPLDMGTCFDEFSEIAHADFFERPGMDEKVRKNRRLLHHVMLKAGFTHYESEWWHFDFGDGPWARRMKTTPRYAFCAHEGLK